MPAGPLIAGALRNLRDGSYPAFPFRRSFLSHRLLDDKDAIADTACSAWNRLLAEAGRITPLCSYPWIPAVNV